MNLHLKNHFDKGIIACKNIKYRHVKMDVRTFVCDNYRVVTLYLTVSGIILPSLKSIGQF